MMTTRQRGGGGARARCAAPVPMDVPGAAWARCRVALKSSWPSRALGGGSGGCATACSWSCCGAAWCGSGGEQTDAVDNDRARREGRVADHVPSGACAFVKGFIMMKRRGAGRAGAGGSGSVAREATAARRRARRRLGVAAGRQRCGRVARVWASVGGVRTGVERGGGVGRAKKRAAKSRANRLRRRSSNVVSCIVASTSEGISTKASSHSCRNGGNRATNAKREPSRGAVTRFSCATLSESPTSRQWPRCGKQATRETTTTKTKNAHRARCG